MTTLTLENVRKLYPGNVCAVDELTLTVAEGELVVLVGPSGCGKTTTLRLIAGLEEPSGGTISIAGRRVNGVPPKDRDVAMVFQNYALYPHLSVYGNLAFALRMRQTARAEIRRRVGEAAELLGIADLLARRPGELSGGQRQRVALGRAMVRRPRIFLFDEPLSNLDAALRAEMRRQLRLLHARLGTTTVYVTHDQTEAMTLGQRIAVLREGRIQQVADPATLYQRPANRFVAGLIGSPAMNFFEGRIERRESHLLFCAEDFTLPIPEAREAALEPFVGRAITLGIRPEHIGLPSAEPNAAAARIRATVEAIELLGAECYVYLNTAKHGFVARMPAGCAVHVGQRIEPAVAIDHLYFFDPTTERALP
jgi:multiple sugar transport system ATP-binding protein